MSPRKQIALLKEEIALLRSDLIENIQALQKRLTKLEKSKENVKPKRKTSKS